MKRLPGYEANEGVGPLFVVGEGLVPWGLMMTYFTEYNAIRKYIDFLIIFFASQHLRSHPKGSTNNCHPEQHYVIQHMWTSYSLIKGNSPMYTVARYVWYPPHPSLPSLHTAGITSSRKCSCQSKVSHQSSHILENIQD